MQYTAISVFILKIQNFNLIFFLQFNPKKFIIFKLYILHTLQSCYVCTDVSINDDNKATVRVPYAELFIIDHCFLRKM